MKTFQEFLIAKFQDILNPKLWNSDQTLKPQVLEHLINVANQFIENVPISEEAVSDIVLTGSNANFNWTATSDLDVHILLNANYFSEKGSCELFSVEDVIQTKKTLWNDKHHISIFGIPVEVYATTLTENIVNNAGVYSLLKQQWISEPKKEQVSIDSGQVQAKSDEISVEINNIINTHCTDLNLVEDLLDRITKMRQSGLQSGGEYSIENLAFKSLRNSGDLDKIRNYYESIQDEELSLESKCRKKKLNFR